MKGTLVILDKAVPLTRSLQGYVGRKCRRAGLPIGWLLMLGLLTVVAPCQSYLTTTGAPSFGAPEPVELGSVDASQGNLHLSIPLGSYSQRGTSQAEPISLEYDSNIWTVSTVGATSMWEPSNGPGAYFEQGGWYFSFLLEAIPQAEGQINNQNCTQDITWMDQSGTTHTFHLTTTGGTNCPSQADAFATDSSGYHLYWNYRFTGSVNIYAPDGTIVYASPTVQDSHGNYVVTEDSNGNYMSHPQNPYYSLNDTLGRQIALYGGTYPNNTVTVTNSQGTAQVQVTFTSINVNTNFQQTGIQETSTSIIVVRSLTIPDNTGSTYYFTYDCNESSGNPACGSPSGRSGYYGELTGIALPTGGTVSYSYTTFKDAYGNKTQWATSRSSSNGFWSYTPQVLSTCSPTQVNCEQQTTVASPTDRTIYTFQLNNGAWPITITKEDLAGNVMSTVSNAWDFSQACVTINCHGASFIRLLTTQATIPTTGGNLTKQTQFTYDSPQYGNRSAIKDWKYIPSGSTFSAVPDRATYMTYLYYLNIGPQTTNNINKPESVTLCNNSGSDSACPGGGARVSQTLYTYDSYGTSGLTQINGIAQHDDTNYSINYTTRGNVTSSSRWVSGSTYLTTSYTYDTTGQMRSETDPAGNTTTISYNDNFFTDEGNDITPATYSPSQPTNAYVTSVTDAVGTQSMGYYFGSGSGAVATGYNGGLTYSHFQDGLNRQTEEIDPIGWKRATYSSPTQSDVYSAVGDVSPSTSCNSCQHTQAILDSWGRTASRVLVNSPLSTGPVEIDDLYDATSRATVESHPYSGTSDPNHVSEDFGYDALDRPTFVTHPDGESTTIAYGPYVTGDGGIASQLGSTSTYGYGYPQIAMDEAGKQRQQWNDGFGNVIEVDEASGNTSTRGTGMITAYEGQGQEVCFEGGCGWEYDSGTVSVTVFGQNFSASYDEYDSGASSLAQQLNDSGLVTAVLSGDSISLTANAPGENSQISGSCQSDWPPGTFSCLYPSVSGISGGTGGISNSPFVTNYTYNVAGGLTSVVQGGQSRIFAYDGLGRKTSEATPEGGTVNYSYTASGGGLCSGDPSNVCQRTDARGVVTTFTYDHANRLTGTAYTIPGGKNIAPMPNVCTTSPNGTAANVCQYYDQGGAAAHAIGELTEMIDPTGSETYSHDAGGRMTQLSKIINGQTYNIAYHYDVGGDVTQITYPSGRVVQQAYNTVGQLCEIAATVTGCADSTYYASAFSYNAPGDLLGFSYGNGVTAAFTYAAARAQLSSLVYAKAGSTYFGLQYWYQQNSPNCPNGNTGNNGSIQCITDLNDSGRNASYNYDLLGRMISEKTTGSPNYPQWGLTQTYDRFGNRWSQTVTAGSGPSSSLTFGTNGINGSMTNQPNGYLFDSSGNMTVEPLAPNNDMTYDGESRMTAFSGGGGAGTYTYDGNGIRVIKSVSGATSTVSIFSGGSVIAEYDNGAGPSSPSREYIYNGAGESAKLLAMISGGSTTYYHQDQLSVRLTTNGSGGIVTQEGTYPFGELWYQTGTANKWFFTSYNQDTESGLDYALARYYDSRTGTFCSADPLAGSADDPQSWNRYPYGRNEPVDITDPSGKSWWSSLLIDVGVAAAMYFAPEIETFIGNEFGIALGDSDQAILTAKSVNYGNQAAGLLTRGAATATTSIADGGGQAAGAALPIAVGIGAAQIAQQNAEKNSKLNKKNCQQDLKALGTSAEAVQAGLHDAQIVNGTTSNTTIASLAANTFAAQDFSKAFGSETVSQGMTADPTIKALAQLRGNNIYINPALWHPNDYWQNQYDILHEVAAHNAGGQPDAYAQIHLHIKVQKNTSNISTKLGSDCF